MRAHHTGLLVAFALTLLLPAGARAQSAPNEAQLEEARAQYREGVAAFRARRYGDAVVAFERSFHIRPHPTTLYNAAEARLRAGDTTGAVQQLREMLAMTDPAPTEQDTERARALAREAGENDLQPRIQTSGGPCPACPTCPPARECPACPPPQVVERGPAPILPVVAAVGGGVLLGVGFGFMGAAWAQAGAFASPNNTAYNLQLELRASGDVYRWIGLTGIVLGLAAEVTAIVLAVRPPAAAPPRANADRGRLRARPATTARLDVGLGGLTVAGTF